MMFLFKIPFYHNKLLKYEESKKSKLCEKQKKYAENGGFQSMKEGVKPQLQSTEVEKAKRTFGCHR